MKVVSEFFPNEEIHFNYPHPKLIWSGSSRLMELDIFIPSLQLAFEYQGAQHYAQNASSSKMFENNVETQKRDEIKREACKLEGITLIAVPFW